MRILGGCLALVSILCAAGCSAVVVDSPIGEAPLRIEPEEWEGEWLAVAADSDDRVIGAIEVVDPAMGLIRATWIEDGEPRRTDIHLLQSGDWTFASVPYVADFGYPGSGATPQAMAYLWGRFIKRDNHIFLWSPRVSRFRDLIEGRELPGQLREGEGDAFLGTLAPEDYAFIVSDTSGSLFEWDAPAVLIRVGQ